MGNSIRFRLWLAATVSILVALGIAGAGLRYLFELHVERRVVGELTVDLNELIGATTFTSDGHLMVAPVLTDPRFANPLSGYYWQVEDIAAGGLDAHDLCGTPSWFCLRGAQLVSCERSRSSRALVANSVLRSSVRSSMPGAIPFAQSWRKIIEPLRCL